MVDRAGPKSESMKKTREPTREELLRRGEVPNYFNGDWKGRDPVEAEILEDCYVENDYTMYHEWPFRCEGVVFHNRQDMMEFAWALSRNQDRDVWTQTPTGFPEKVNWWSEERMTNDGTWDKMAADKLREINEKIRAEQLDTPTIDNKIDPPSRAEAKGRRRAYWDPKLGKTVITEEFEAESVSPNRKRQIERLKKLGIDPLEPDTTQEHKAPNAS